MNELHLETSPYLLQHANNPVHWKAWTDITLQKALQENKLLLISIGYSACHWCHVMEHESFEDDEVAEVMNAHFINIKIDREERPDIDSIYMKAVQLMTGQGGWPLNVVALPDGKPVWGGTYFRKKDWINSLEKLQELFEQQPETLLEYSEQLLSGINSLNTIPLSDSKLESTDFLEKIIEKWQKSFDWEFGGMARAPKFMMPTNYEFLLRYGYQTKNKQLLDFVELTITRMAYGGLFDTIDGGFARYSVDMKWHIPHFEKMLYDNGQLVSLYSNAYKYYKNTLFKDVIQKTLSFIEKEWLTTEDYFYSSFDADSLIDENHLEEGAFYVWTKAELQNILKEGFDLFTKVFNINDFGFWEKENYVLIQNQSLNEIAIQEKISLETLVEKKKNWEKTLYTFREKRNKPRLDDKCITSWNALMLKGFVEGYKALGENKYLEIALKNAHFIVKKLWSAEGHLFRTYKNGDTKLSGYLEDYAHIIAAFIQLYEVTMEEYWLQNAKQLTDYCFDYFYDQEAQFFCFNSSRDFSLITKIFEVEDNVIPSSNSVMADNLFRLSIYFENSYYERVSYQMLQNILPTIDYPSAFSNWLNVYLNFKEQNKELAICGYNIKNDLKKIQSLYIPNIILGATTLDSSVPFLKHRFEENKTLYYVCQNKSCLAPSSDFEEILNQIII